MNKFLMSHISDKPINIDKLEVQSFEMNIYLVKLYVNGTEGFVYSDQDRPMRFYNAQHIREAFEGCEVTSAIMLHDTPYDEMIGNPNKAEQSMAMPFSMQQPY